MVGYIPGVLEYPEIAVNSQGRHVGPDEASCSFITTKYVIQRFSISFQASKKSFFDHKDSGESQLTPSADDADTPLRRLTEKCRYNVRVSDLTPPSTGRLSEGPENRTSDLKKEDGPSKEVAKTGEDIALGEADSNCGGMLSDLEPKSASDERYVLGLENRIGLVNFGELKNMYLQEIWGQNSNIVPPMFE